MKKIKTLLIIAIIFLTTSIRAEAHDESYKDVMVYLKSDIHKQAKEIAGEDDDKFILSLKSLAEKDQENIIEIIEKSDEVVEYKGYFISNVIHLVGSDDIVEELSRHEDVDYISENKEINRPLASFSELATSTKGYNWNMDIMDIEYARQKYGVDGQGITIGFIDSGVDFNHDEISSNYRGLDPLTGQRNDEGNFKDILGRADISKIHATGVISIAVGAENGYVGGVAPGADWILASAFDEDTSSNDTLLEAAEWMLAPDGDPSKRPDIINNSWGGDAPNERWFKDILDTWSQLDIFSVFAAGNDMEGDIYPGSIENPASLPSAFAVGSIGPDKSLSYFSKIGPSTVNPNIIKPEVVAPGESITIAMTGNRHGTFRGTSAATPHISGLAALLMEARPDADIEDYRRVIIESCEPLTSETYPSSPNMGFGYGLPNADRALDLAYNMKVTDRISGDNRFLTAINLSRAYFDRAETVYLANGSSYIDALVMTSLTNLSDGPLLLTSKDNIGQETIEEINRLRPENIVVIGGENTISPRVLGQIQDQTGLSSTRVAGENRYHTSSLIAKGLASQRPVKEVYLVNGLQEVDAISASGPAKHENKPVLLTDPEELPEIIVKSLEDLGADRVTIIGGENTVSSEIEEELLSMGFLVERIGGKDRYETSVMVNADIYQRASNIFLANGIRSVDALTAGPIAGSYAYPVLLIPGDDIPNTCGTYINSTGTRNISILGGTNSVSKGIEYKMLFY